MTLGSHQRCVGETQSWITPKPLIAALGGPEAFDLDPCASDPQPWPCAKTSWTTGGLQRPWHGRNLGSILRSTATKLADGSSASLTTSPAASRSCMRGPKPNGSPIAGRTPGPCCSWLAGCTFTIRTVDERRLIRELQQCSSPSASRLRGVFADQGSPAASSPCGKVLI